MSVASCARSARFQDPVGPGALSVVHRPRLRFAQVPDPGDERDHSGETKGRYVYSPGIRSLGALGVLGWQVSPWGVGGSVVTVTLALVVVMVGYFGLWRNQTADDSAV